MSVQAVLFLGFVLDRDFVASESGITWAPNVTRPTDAQIAAAILPAAKTARIAAVNAECEARILAVWPITRQLSTLAGRHGAQAQADMQAWLQAHIDPSNDANALVDAVPEGPNAVEQVEAVTVAWPA